MAFSLKDNGILSELAGFCDLILEQDRVGDAQQLLYILEGFFKDQAAFFKNNPALARTYKEYLAKAKFVCLPNLEEKEIFDLLKNHLSFVLSAPAYDLADKLRQKALTIYDLEDRDKFKDGAKNAFLKNQEIITPGRKVKINNLDEEGTIGNWLKDYYMKVGLEPADSLRQNQYLSNNPNLNGLNAAAKLKLKNLVSVFEKLKISSASKGGLEESFPALSPDGEMVMISHGRPEKISPDFRRLYDEVTAAKGKTGGKSAPTPEKQPVVPAVPAAELEAELKNYAPGSLEYKALKEEIKRLRKSDAKK